LCSVASSSPPPLTVLLCCVLFLPRIDVSTQLFLASSCLMFTYYYRLILAYLTACWAGLSKQGTQGLASI
jgi:hypothetical protein